MLKIEAYNQLKNECDNNSVNLIAVSKRKSMDSILELHRIGQVDFGENRVQELKEKFAIICKSLCEKEIEIQNILKNIEPKNDS